MCTVKLVNKDGLISHFWSDSDIRYFRKFWYPIIVILILTRQRVQGHRTYEVAIAKPEVRLLLLAVLVSDIKTKDVFGMKELHLVYKLKPFLSGPCSGNTSLFYLNIKFLALTLSKMWSKQVFDMQMVPPEEVAWLGVQSESFCSLWPKDYPCQTLCPNFNSL